MRRRFLLIGGAAAPLAIGISGCSTQDLQRYADERPNLDLRQYFSGTIDAWGIFTDRSGQVVKRFVVVMDCRWDGENGVLDEAFTYSDGTTQRRIWRLRHLGGGRYEGTADDVVGTAHGQTVGNAFNWTYTMRLPVDDSVYEVEFDDWMYLMDERVMLNKAVMSKFGFRLGEVTLSFTRRTPIEAA